MNKSDANGHQAKAPPNWAEIYLNKNPERKEQLKKAKTESERQVLLTKWKKEDQEDRDSRAVGVVVFYGGGAIAIMVAPEVAIAGGVYLAKKQVVKQATQHVVKQTSKRAGDVFSKTEVAGLAKLFGKGPAGAKELLTKLKGGKVDLPVGVSRSTLKKYESIARDAIEGKMDKIGTQELRLEAIRKLLGG